MRLYRNKNAAITPCEGAKRSRKWRHTRGSGAEQKHRARTSLPAAPCRRNSAIEDACYYWYSNDVAINAIPPEIVECGISGAKFSGMYREVDGAIGTMGATQRMGQRLRATTQDVTSSRDNTTEQSAGISKAHFTLTAHEGPIEGPTQTFLIWIP